MGTRIHPSIEDTIMNHYDKKMVLVMNKIDLIPKDAVSGWLNYLRKSRPTLAIKCGTNGKDIGRSEVDCQGALSSSCGVGVEGLLGLLKNYARSSGGGKTCITVGIIGYPNVGKSSILNTLKRSRAVGVSPRPGFTTTMQEVVLDRNVRLIDSPGVVFDDSENLNNGASTMLRNCVDADSIDDPIPAVQALLDRCTTESLMMTYSIPAFPKGDAMIFLAMIAKRNGKVLKGGIPDKAMAARLVIRDWNSGKIPYFTRPPSMKEENSNIVRNDAKIVSGFGEEFDVNKFDEEIMNELENNDEMDFVQMETKETTDDDMDVSSAVEFLRGKEYDDDMKMDEDDDIESKAISNQKIVCTNAIAADAEDYDF
jgi:nuclear GTP-binding protein